MNNAVEVDTIDSKTKVVHNLLFVVERRTKIQHGKLRMQLLQLQPGQQVVCRVERLHRDGQKDDRLIAFEIRVDDRS